MFKYLIREIKIFKITWVTIETIEQQNPAMKAVINIVSTDLAKTVKNHDSENGKDIKAKTLLRPCCIAKPPNIPPNNLYKWDHIVLILN